MFNIEQSFLLLFTIVMMALVLSFGTSIASAQADEPSPIEITGFGDFFYAVRQGNEQEDDFELGQVEVDLAATIDEEISIETAIAYDTEGGTFGLGCFIVDFHLFGSEGGHFRPAVDIDHSGIIVGQFDVPFGIDWNVYPSIDRKLVSGPLVVENTHDFWNDFGVQGYLETKWFNAVVYGTNGFGYESTDNAGKPVNVEMKAAFGGRIGFKLHETIEIGGSYTGFLNQDNKLDMSLMGADLQFNYEGLSIKGEYIAHGLALAGDNDVINTGFYAQGMYNFGKFFLVSRYGIFLPDMEEANNLTRVSTGVGWVIRENCELRFEYQADPENDDDVAFLQLAAGF